MVIVHSFYISFPHGTVDMQPESVDIDSVSLQLTGGGFLEFLFTRRNPTVMYWVQFSSPGIFYAPKLGYPPGKRLAIEYVYNCHVL